MTDETIPPAKKKLPPGLKLLLDLGPLLAFFVTLYAFGIFAATGVIIAATLASVIVTYTLIRRVPLMLLVTAGFVLVFGGLTLYLQDQRYIQIKVTVYYLLVSSALLGGLMFGKSFIGYLFDEAFKLDQEGWRILTLRWGLFFLAMAGLNEIIRAGFDIQIWGYFKLATVVLTFLFAMTQIPLISRHALTEEPPAESA